METMNETTKIRPLVLKYCVGCGIDVGCGDEKICREAIGIDAGLGSVEFRNLSCVNIKQCVSDVSMFCDGSLDYVYSSHFLEHLKLPDVMVSSMCRALCVGGYLIIYLPDRLLYKEPNPDHIHMWTLFDFKKMIPKNMEVVEEIAAHYYSFLVVLRKKS